MSRPTAQIAAEQYRTTDSARREEAAAHQRLRESIEEHDRLLRGLRRTVCWTLIGVLIALACSTGTLVSLYRN